MSELEYRNVAGVEVRGDAVGKFGIRVAIACDALPGRLPDAVRHAASDAAERLKEALTESLLAADPNAMFAASTERRDLLDCFGDERIFVEEVENGYCPLACCKHRPWFKVTTKAGRFTIGWRERVISIDWIDTRGTASAQELFPDEEVTKGVRSIHAWSLEDAERYIAAVIASTN